MYEIYGIVKVEYYSCSNQTTGKPREMKCKPDTGGSVNVMPLAAYKLINPSEFDKDGKPKGDTVVM